MVEAWETYYSANELKKIQSIELESLDVLSAVCEKLGIDYFLYGGSLLGAVKYKGFVPWDDDLDIALMRNDYEKLLREGPQLLPDGYELQEPRINIRTPYPYIKLRKTNTTMVEYIYRNIKINHGVYFDIYPIDNLPDDDVELARNHSQLAKIVRVLQRRQTFSISTPMKSCRDVGRQLFAFFRFIAANLIPHAYLVNKMNNLMTKYNGLPTLRQGNMFFPDPINSFDGIYPTVEVLFEGRKMKVPKGYEINLSNRYGDIANDPPMDERVGHKPYILKLDFED